MHNAKPNIVKTDADTSNWKKDGHGIWRRKNNQNIRITPAAYGFIARYFHLEVCDPGTGEAFHYTTPEAAMCAADLEWPADEYAHHPRT